MNQESRIKNNYGTKLKILMTLSSIFTLLIIGLLVFQIKSTTNSKSVNSPTLTKTMVVGNTKIKVELTETIGQKELGLSYRKSLPQDHGMLFDFSDSPSKPGFWMKGMNFDLDLIWIKNNKIIAITKNVKKPTDQKETLELYYPPSKIDYVLEVNSGWSDKNNIHVGDPISTQNQK